MVFNLLSFSDHNSVIYVCYVLGEYALIVISISNFEKNSRIKDGMERSCLQQK